ncbi:MAG: hypothetical protein V1645_03040 [archaeon]
MKKTLFLLLLILIPATYALTETKDKLNLNSTATVWGKTIKILDATSEGAVKYEVDGKKDMIIFGELTKETNGMKVNFLNFTYIDETYVVISVELTVNAQCGDGLCDKNMTESNDTCCTDCGCTTGECTGNICGIAQCHADEDCDDKNNCTIDRCNSEKECYTTPTVICNNGDGCCPSECGWENDTDCEKEPEIIPMCVNDTDCTDDDGCTTDKCEGNPANCTHTKTEGCSLNRKCYNMTERADDYYCTKEGMEKQKENKEPCTENYECKENICTKNQCGKESKRGLYIGIMVAILTFVALMFTGYTIFVKKELKKEEGQDLKPEDNSETT